MVEYRVSDKLVSEIDAADKTLDKPRDPSIENVRARFYEKLNEALDKMAADHGVTRGQLIKMGKDFLQEMENNRLRAYLAQNPHEESEQILDLLKKIEDK